MQEREKKQPEGDQPTDPGAGNPAAGNLNALRAKGAAHLDAAHSIISKVLSSNSTEFNQAVRQESGQ